MLKDSWARGIPLDEFIDQAEANQEMWRTVRKVSTVPASLLERLRGLPGPRKLLVLAEDWCGDAINTVPVLAKLADELPRVQMRVLRRDENLELMDAHLSGTSRAIPVAIVVDENFRELGWWGSRPAPLQEWFLSPEAQAMEKSERYRELRRWYARDRGVTTLEEIAVLLEKEAAGYEAETSIKVA